MVVIAKDFLDSRENSAGMTVARGSAIMRMTDWCGKNASS